MIKVTFYKNSDGSYAGFQSLGHAGYSEHGSDIICAAVSVLVINTINSITELTDDDIEVEADENKGLIKCMLNNPSDKTILFMESLLLGLNGIVNDNNGEYIKVIFKEV